MTLWIKEGYKQAVVRRQKDFSSMLHLHPLKISTVKLKQPKRLCIWSPRILSGVPHKIVSAQITMSAKMSATNESDTILTEEEEPPSKFVDPADREEKNQKGHWAGKWASEVRKLEEGWKRQREERRKAMDKLTLLGESMAGQRRDVAALTLKMAAIGRDHAILKRKREISDEKWRQKTAETAEMLRRVARLRHEVKHLHEWKASQRQRVKEQRVTDNDTDDANESETKKARSNPNPSVEDATAVENDNNQQNSN